MRFRVRFCSVYMNLNQLYLVISVSIKISMKTRRAGITAAKAAQTGRSSPMGLMNHPRFSASVGDNPSGTSSFCKRQAKSNLLVRSVSVSASVKFTLTDRMRSEPHLSVKRSVNNVAMINFDGDGEGHGQGDGTFTIFKQS